MKGRYPYIILTILSMAIAISAVLISLAQIHDNEKKFCQLVAISNQHPIPAKPDNGSTQIEMRARAMYNGYNNFGHSLGCTG